MTTTPADIRAAVTAQALTTVLAEGGALRESMTPYLYFRDAARSPAHKEVAVGTVASVPKTGRQRPGDTVLADTEIRVALAYQIPTHAPSVDPALVIGRELRSHVLARSDTYPVTFQLVWVREDIAALPAPGWVVVEQVFSALHYMTI